MRFYHWIGAALIITVVALACSTIMSPYSYVMNNCQGSGCRCVATYANENLTYAQTVEFVDIYFGGTIDPSIFGRILSGDPVGLAVVHTIGTCAQNPVHN